jgi:hypothetical protein
LDFNRIRQVNRSAHQWSDGQVLAVLRSHELGLKQMFPGEWLARAIITSSCLLADYGTNKQVSLEGLVAPFGLEAAWEKTCVLFTTQAAGCWIYLGLASLSDAPG